MLFEFIVGLISPFHLMHHYTFAINNYFCCCRLAFKTWENITVSDITSVTNLNANFHPESFVLLCHTLFLMVQIPVHLLVQNLKMTNFPKGGNVHAGKKVCCGTFNMLVAGLTL